MNRPTKIILIFVTWLMVLHLIEQVALPSAPNKVFVPLIFHQQVAVETFYQAKGTLGSQLHKPLMYKIKVTYLFTESNFSFFLLFALFFGWHPLSVD
jgi:hypothetical protein